MFNQKGLGPNVGFERTTNGGQTWTPTAKLFYQSDHLGIISPISWSFQGAQDGWVLSDHRTANGVATQLYRTTDGAATWTQVAIHNPLTHWTAIDFFSPALGWATAASASTPLWETTDGGVHWHRVLGLSTFVK